MKAMVRTSYTGSAYITPDRLYAFEMDDDDGSDEISGTILADTGEEMFILIVGCAHIDYNDWELIYE